MLGKTFRDETITLTVFGDEPVKQIIFLLSPDPTAKSVWADNCHDIYDVGHVLAPPEIRPSRFMLPEPEPMGA